MALSCTFGVPWVSAGKRFPRVASFAARTAAALMDQSICRSQLCVDDPALSVIGPLAVAERELSIPLMWWLVLGPSFAWEKASFGPGAHNWIGVRFIPGPTQTIMELPNEFLRSTLSAIEPLCAMRGLVSLAAARSAVGKCARLAYIVPVATAFVASLWGALGGALAASKAGLPGTKPHLLPVRRFMGAARWIRRLLLEAISKHARSSGAWLLRRVMEDSLPLTTSFCITCDASPWGGGGILWINSRPAEYTHFTWSSFTLRFLSAERTNRCQTLFEFLTVFLCLLTFERAVVSHGVAVGGDNLSSLQNAIDCKSTVPAINLIAREIAWRKGLRSWKLVAPLSKGSQHCRRCPLTPCRSGSFAATRRRPPGCQPSAATRAVGGYMARSL